MADEEQNEEVTQETEAETPEVEEAPEAEAAPEVEGTPEAEAPTEEEVPAEEPAAEEETPVEEPAAEEEVPATVSPTHPKQLRKLGRSTHSGEVKSPRTPEQRAAERTERRARNAATRRSYRARQRAKDQQRERTPKPAVPAEPKAEGTQKIRQGIVVSDRADKTITVRIDAAHRHPRYEKIIRSSTTLHAHDENNDAHAGDTVRLIESRPLSRTKRWRLVDVLERAK